MTYLAVEERASRDSIANLFWGDRSEARARHNVRQALSKIRSVCEPVIESQGDLLRLDPEHCSVDVVEFLQFTDPGRSSVYFSSILKKVPGLFSAFPYQPFQPG